MPNKIVYFDEVRLDLKAAKSWYKNHQIGLEKRFEQEIKKAIQQIAKTPHSFGIRYKNVRLFNLKIFPYVIHFYFEEDTNFIVITAIIHKNRPPEISRNRI